MSHKWRKIVTQQPYESNTIVLKYQRLRMINTKKTLPLLHHCF